MPHLHALLTGINNYHPDSRVSSLYGCHNDALLWKDFLQQQFKGRLSMECLLDADVSYQNVVELCGEAFLGRAQKDDIVLLTYSGHGSREGSASEFDRYYPERLQETLVLYDSRTPGGLDLADKELALLIERLARKGAQVVVVLDCCHAGSGTRNAADMLLGAPRQYSERTGRRPLDSYLHGAYTDRLAQGNFYLPNSRHILLAACDRKEKAYELQTQQGLFTKSMFQALTETEGRLSYADLFTRSRAAMAQVTDRQHPQFEPQGFFNSFGGFLGLGTAAEGAQVQVSFKENAWQVNMGAVNGLPVSGAGKPEFELFENGNSIGLLRIEGVGLDKSTLQIGDLLLSKDANYEARLRSLPEPGAIYSLEASTEALAQQTREALVLFKPTYFELQQDAPDAPYRMIMNEEGIELIRQSDGFLLRRIEGDDWPNMLQDAFELLEHIARWEKQVNLDNPHTQLQTQDVELEFIELDARDVVVRNDSTKREIVVDIVRQGGVEEVVPFMLKVHNNGGKERHCALFYASSRYGFIQAGFNEPVPANSEAIAIERDEDGRRTHFLLNGKNESLDIFKLFVSNTKVQGETMMIKPVKQLGETKKYFRTRGEKSVLRGVERGWSGDPFEGGYKNINDWFSITLRVHCVAKEARINELETVQVANNSVRILPHPQLRGDISLATVGGAYRSLEPMAEVAKMARYQDTRMLSFESASEEIVATPDMLELTELEGTEGVTENNPLQIELAAMLQKTDSTEELLLPLTFDGEHLLPVGYSERQSNGDAHIRIHQLPDTYDVGRRSLKKALKLCFLKLVMRKKETHQLCWVDYRGTKPVRRSEGLHGKVAEARRILLLIHGIIGDTQGMCNFAAPLLLPQGQQPASFDLVLSFDYESLNTGIEQTAGALADALRGAGIAPGHDKHLTLLAHSMGGLVSRHFIQSNSGNKVVSRLVLAGTPNEGSEIAKIATYRDYAIPILTFLINLPWGIPAAATVLAIMKKSSTLTVTLEQMQSDSGFLQSLNRGSLHGVPCNIVAGDLQQYLYKMDDQKKLMDKILHLGGKLFYKNEPNDVAVSVESVFSVPDAVEKAILACHHLNYFDDPESVQAIMEVLRK